MNTNGSGLAVRMFREKTHLSDNNDLQETAAMHNDVVLELEPSPGNPRNSEGAFVTLADGTVLFAYTHFYGGGHDDSGARIVLRRSHDGGRTWSGTDEVLVENEGRDNVMSVSLLRLANGTLGFWYLCKDGAGDCRPRQRLSTDESRTWSPPQTMVPVPGYFVLNNDRVVQLRGGRLIAPVAFHRLRQEGQGQSSSAGMDGRAIMFWYLSDDSGVSWREAKTWWACPQQCASGLQEPGVVELSDGRLFCWARTTLGCQYGCTSDDGGETWSAPRPTGFQSPCSPLSLKRTPATGHLLAVWNDPSRPLAPAPPGVQRQSRTPLVAAVSRDEGTTWSAGRVLEDSPVHGFCYTAIHFVDDSALLAYCAGGEETGGILNRLRLRRLSVDWLHGGK